MTITFSNSVKLSLTVLLAAVVLLWSISAAIASGKAQAQAQAVYHNAGAAVDALEFFYHDQDRYPTAVEFSDLNIMSRYFTLFPLPDFPSKNCPSSFTYRLISPRSYQLNFCLPSSFNGRPAGWNQMTQNKSS